MNYDDLIRSVAQDTGLNPTPWDQEGASELKINFKPDGSYTKQIQGTWKPVAQLAQKMAKGREPSPSMRGMSPEMILQFADRQGEAGEQRKRDLGLFAGIVEKMQGQKAAARKQDFEEHKYNNPDLVKLPGVPVPIKRDQVTQALRDQATQRLNEGRLSAEKYGLITQMLDAKDAMKTRSAQRAASYASANAANVRAEAQRRGLDQFIDVPFGDLGSASVRGSDLLKFWNPESGELGFSGEAGGTDEKIGLSADEKRAWDFVNNLRFNQYTKDGEPRRELKRIEPAMVSRADEILKPLGKALYTMPFTEDGWLGDTEKEAYLIVDPNAPISEILKQLEAGLVSEYGLDPEQARNYVIDHAKQLRSKTGNK